MLFGDFRDLQNPPHGNGMHMVGGFPQRALGQPQHHLLEDMPRRQDPNFFTRRGRLVSMRGSIPRQQQPFAGQPWMKDVVGPIRNFDPSKAVRPSGRDVEPRRFAHPPGRDFNPGPAGRSPAPPARQETPRVRFAPEPPVLGERHGRHKAVQRYEKIKALKPGGMSVAINLLRGRSDGKLYIEKRISIEGMNLKRANAELKTLKTVRGHSNLNQLIESKILDGRFCSTVLEHCDRGSLQDRMEAATKEKVMFCEANIWNILLGVSKALAFLHNGAKAGTYDPVPDWKAIAHLDIKPGNILISTSGGENGQRRIILADFGCAVSIEDLQAGRETGRRQPCGTPQWYPSEGLQGNGYGSKTDLYMPGATIHTVSQLRPIPSTTLPNYGSPCGNRYSADLNRVVKLLTQVDWRARPAARKVAPAALGGLRRSLQQRH